MSLALFFAQNLSNASTFIFRSLRLCVGILLCNSTVTLLKPLNNSNLLLPYEQHYIQTLHHEGKLIPEQNPGETNPLFQMAINPQPPHST